MIKIKIVYLSFAFFLSIYMNSQNKNEELDSILITTPKIMFDNGNSRENIIEWNLRMLSNAKVTNYDKGIILAHINIATQYYNLGKQDCSIKELNLAKNLADEISADDETYAVLYQEFSQVYYTLGLFESSLEYNSKSIYYIKKSGLGKGYRKILLDYCYKTRGANFIAIKSDSSKVYFYKALSINQTPLNSVYLANYYIEKQRFDSAYKYLDKVDEMKDFKSLSDYGLAVYYRAWGTYFLRQFDMKNAIIFFEKSLANSKSGRNRKHLVGLYTDLATSYHHVGDLKNERRILNNLKVFNGVHEKVQGTSIELVIAELKRKKIEEEGKKNKIIILISIVGFVLIFLMAFIIYFNNKRKSRMLFQKNIIIEKQKIIKQELQSKLLDGADDIYKSAKDRDPNFYNKFQKFYPKFHHNLLDLNPKLISSELIILAYIFLGFETKEIADLLFLSPRTIQNRKYMIRRKLNIPSNNDMTLWIKSINK